MNNTTLSRRASKKSSKRRSALRSSVALETLEIRNLLAANTLAFVDNLSINEEGGTRDIQLDISASSSTVLGVRVSGTSGNLDPDVPLIFGRDTDRTNPANWVTPISAMKDVHGTTDSLVYFQVTGNQQFTLQIGGESGTGDFIAEIFMFGDTDGQHGVTEYEYMQAVAAELQGRGAGNHNTAMYFQSQWGINFNQSQYNVAFDANGDGKIDGHELSMVNGNYQATVNSGGVPITIDLIGDSEAPVVTAGVAVDSGISASDNLTNVTADADGNAIVGFATDDSTITSLYVMFDGIPGNKIDLTTISAGSINSLSVGDNKIEFGFSIDDLETLRGGAVVNQGPLTLTFLSEDALGNSGSFDLVFEFDTVAPATGTIIIDPDDDTGASDSDGITSVTQPTFEAQAEAGAKVEFFITFQGETQAKLLGAGTEVSAGIFTFTPEVGLNDGNYQITIVATDAAGNVSDPSSPLAIQIDTAAPASPAALDLTNQTLNNNLTQDAFANITGTTEANAVVRLVIADDVIATTTANGSGQFSFSNIPLELGDNQLVFIAEDLAGNTSQTTFHVTRNTEPTVNNQQFAVDENSPQGTVVGTVVADSGDGAADTLTFEITGASVGYENAFTIDGQSGVIIVNDQSLLDFETKAVITLTVQITDSLGDGLGGSGLTDTATVTIALNDVNEAPSIEAATFELLENTLDPAVEHSPAGTVVGKFAITDPDQDDDQFTFNIISGNTNGAFEVVFVDDNGDYYGEIRVLNPAALNFQVTPTFELVVSVTDSGGPDGAGSELTSAPVTYTINLRDVIENHDLGTIAENPVGGVHETVVGQVVGRITSPDFDYSQDYTFSIVAGNTGGAFAIDSQGVITVANADPSVLNFEVNPVFTLEVEVTDAGAPGISPYSAFVTIGLEDRNDAPTVDQAGLDALDLNIDENPEEDDSLNNTVDLADFFDDVDAGQTLTFTIVGGNTGNAFKIDANNHIVVNNPAAIDFEVNPQFVLTIRATDDGTNPAPLFVEGTVTININNLNELPVADGDEITLAEPIRFVIASDPAEEGEIVASIGLVDPEGDELTYTQVAGGTGDPFFSIDSEGNIILDNALPDDWDPEEVSRQYTLIFDLQDDNHLNLPNGVQTASGVTLTITVSKNQAPVFDSPTVTEFSISENVAGSVQVGDNLDPVVVISATDPEDDPITYSVAPNANFNEQALADLFAVVEVDGEFRLVVADAENLRYNFVNGLGAIDGTFDLDLIAADAVNETRLTISITVIDENDQPVFEAPTPGSVTVEELVQHFDDANNNIQPNDFVYDLTDSFTDPDINDVLQFTIVATVATGTQVDLSGAFAIVGNNLVIGDPTLIDFEALQAAGATSITVTILADDQQGEANSTVTGDIVIEVLDQNELPTVTEPIDPLGIAFADVDDFTTNRVVGNISSVLTLVDPEGDAIFYLQSSGGDDDVFEIDANGDIVQVGEVDLLNNISRAFEIFFYIEDSQGLHSFDDLGFPAFTLTITVTDNLPPVISSGNSFVVNEAAANGTVVFEVVATDPEEDYPLNFSINDPTGSFEIVATSDTTANIVVLDTNNLVFNPGDPTFQITVTVTDQEGSSVQQVITVEVENLPPALVEDPAEIHLQVNEGNVVWNGEDNFYIQTFTNAEYNFRGQFVDQEGDAFTLFVANEAELLAADYIQSVVYDNANDQLVVTFVHYTAAQNRSAVVVQLGADDGITSPDPAAILDVDLSVNAETTIDIRMIPLLMPTDNATAIGGVNPNNLPMSIDRLADEQTFVVEIWVNDMYTANEAAQGRFHALGISFASFDFMFDNTFLTANKVFIPNELKLPVGSALIDNANGRIEEFAAWNGLPDENDPNPPNPEFLIGANGQFVRLGYLEFTVQSGVDSGGAALDSLLSIDFGSANTSVNHLPQPLDGPRGTINPSQITVTNPEVEIIDAVKFSVDLTQSNVVIPTGPTGGKINGAEIAGQSGTGHTTAVSGDIYIVFNGDPNNPTSMEIIGMDLFLANGGNYKAGAPGSPGGAPTSSATPGNLGLSASPPSGSGNLNIDMAIRDTVIRFTGGNSTINIDGGSFSASGLNLGISNGFADTQAVQTSPFEFSLERNSLAGTSLASAGAENSTIVGDGMGGFTLTLNLQREILASMFTVGNFNIDLDLWFNATIVAEVFNGGAPLMGSVVGNNNKPLEEGSGVFLTVVKNPTHVNPNQPRTELPESLTWTDEWSSVWVEVWGNTADAAGIYGGYVDIAYNSKVYTATEFQYASNFDLDRSGSVDDAAGMITGLGSRSETLDQGNGGFVLLGRVKLESLEGDGIEVGLDKDFKPESLGLEVTSSNLDFTGLGTLATPVVQVPKVEVWGVAYDINNDGRIGLADFTQFISAYGQSSLTSDNPLASAFDFNNDGKVGLADFTYFIQNFGATKGGDKAVVFPTSFTQTWVGQQIHLNGPNSLQEVFDAALQDWQDAIGWDHAIDVQLVVANLPGSQLGEAQLLRLDANGLPARGIVTLDTNGAGVGWSADLVGGPAEGLYDLYTVILHELGHVYGFMEQYSSFGANIALDHLGNKVYYGPDFTALLDSPGQHLDEIAHPGDVMNDTLDPGVRKTISELNVQMLLAAYQNATGGSVVDTTSAALHAAPVSSVETELPSAAAQDVLPVVVSTTVAAPDKAEFVMGQIAELTAISGRTGTAVVMPEALTSKLQQNGLRVHTRSTLHDVNAQDDIDSAVAEYDFDEFSDLLGVSDESPEFELAASSETSEGLDDLFANWDDDQA